jgi:hypothetical protein
LAEDSGQASDLPVWTRYLGILRGVPITAVTIFPVVCGEDEVNRLVKKVDFKLEFVGNTETGFGFNTPQSASLVKMLSGMLLNQLPGRDNPETPAVVAFI